VLKFSLNALLGNKTTFLTFDLSGYFKSLMHAPPHVFGLTQLMHTWDIMYLFCCSGQSAYRCSIV